MRGIVVSGKVKLFAGVLLLQLGYAGLTVVSAITVNMGISKLVFLTYRSAIAFAFLAPFAYFLEKNDRPPLSLSLVVQFFGLALLGVTVNQGLFYLGLYYLSPTFASAIWNSTPTMILVMSLALRIESVIFFDKYGWAKVGGTLTTLTGATFIVLFKGPILLHNNSHGLFPLSSSSSNEIKNWSLGCTLIIGSCFAWSGWLVLQAPLLKKYPARITLTSFTFFFGVIQLVFISFFMEGDIGMWKIKSKDVILALIYTGIVVSGITFTLQAWCIEKGGPFIVGAFQPVETLTVAIMSSFILGEELYFGGVIGGMIIVIGLYLVLWGRNGDQKRSRIIENRQDEEDLKRSFLGQ